MHGETMKFNEPVCWISYWSLLRQSGATAQKN